MALELKHISKRFYQTTKETIEDINLTIEEGEFVCFVGPSGCGKSTLLNMIAGLQKASQGEIVFNGKLVTAPGADRVVMFQDSALFPWLNVIDNVKFGMKIAGLSNQEQENKARYYLKMVKLSQFDKYAIHQLSGGMRQRVSLARALALDTKILLMDEPFSALDKQTTNMLRDEVEKIWRTTGKTVLLVTHSVEEAIFFADKVVVISSNPGKIKKIFDINLKRPRRIDEEPFIQLRKRILEEVKEEVKKSDESEHDK